MPVFLKSGLLPRISSEIQDAPERNITAAEVRNLFIDLLESCSPIDRINVRDYGCQGNDSNNEVTALTTAFTVASGSGIGVYLPKGRYKLGTNFAVPENVTLSFAPGAILSLNSGITGWIEGKIDAAPHQIFSGAGTYQFGRREKTLVFDTPSDGDSSYRFLNNWGVPIGDFARSESTPNNPILYPEWFGAVINVGTLAQAAKNSAAIARLQDSLTVVGGKMFVNGKLFISDTIHFPGRIKSDNQFSSIPFEIEGQLGTSAIVSYNSGDPGIVVYPTGYHIAYDNFNSYSSKQTIRNITIISRNTAVKISGVSEGFMMDNVEFTACHGQYALDIRYSYTVNLNNLAFITCKNTKAAFNIDNCNQVRVPFFRVNECSGVGVALIDCANVYMNGTSEGNNLYGISGIRVTNSKLDIWMEANGGYAAQAYFRECAGEVQLSPQHNPYTPPNLDPISTCVVNAVRTTEAESDFWTKAKAMGYQLTMPSLFPTGAGGVDGHLQCHFNGSFGLKSGNVPRSGSPAWYLGEQFVPVASGEVLPNGERVIAVNIYPGTHNNNTVGNDSYLELWPYVWNTNVWGGSSGYVNTPYNSGDYLAFRVKTSINASGVEFWKNVIPSGWMTVGAQGSFNSSFGDSFYEQTLSDSLPRWIGGAFRTTAVATGNRIIVTFPNLFFTLGSGLTNLSPPSGGAYKIYLHDAEVYRIPASF